MKRVVLSLVIALIVLAGCIGNGTQPVDPSTPESTTHPTGGSGEQTDYAKPVAIPTLPDDELRVICDELDDTPGPYSGTKTNCYQLLDASEESCSALPENADEVCYTALAIKNDDVSLCVHVKDNERYAFRCYGYFALKNKDAGLCSNAHEDDTENCLGLVAYITKQDVCQNPDYELCYTYLAFARKDGSVCDNLDYTKNCQRDVAMLTGDITCDGGYRECSREAIYKDDVTVCDGADSINDCYENFIRLHYTNDASICGLYDLPQQKGSGQANCYIVMSQRTLDAAYCTSAFGTESGNKGARDRCLYGLVERAKGIPSSFVSGVADSKDVDIFESQGYYLDAYTWYG